MSRVGKKPIDIPEKVNIEIKERLIKAQGPLGTMDFTLPEAISINKKDNKLFLELKDKSSRVSNALYGTVRARVNNLVFGVGIGFAKVLEIKGLGYRSQVSGSKLNMELGFSHPINLDIPQGITVETDAKKNMLTIKGADKVLVGDFAARIKRLRPPEPYKASGIKYAGEHIVKKAGKSASAGGKK